MFIEIAYSLETQRKIQYDRLTIERVNFSAISKREQVTFPED